MTTIENVIVISGGLTDLQRHKIEMILSNMDERLAMVKVSGTLVAESLALPDGTVIKDIYKDRSAHSNHTFVMVLQHSDFPLAKYGEPYPEPIVTFHADYGKKPSTWITTEIDFGEDEA